MGAIERRPKENEMSKLLGTIIALAALALSINTFDATPDTDERVQPFSGNRNIHSQLSQLEAEGY